MIVSVAVTPVRICTDAGVWMPSVTARFAAAPSGVTIMTNLLTPSGAVCTASAGNDQRVGCSAASDGCVDGRAGFQGSLRILDAQPYFNRGAAGVERRADERDLRRHGIVEPGNGDAGRCAHSELLGLHLREVELGQQRGSIHYRDHRSAGGGCLPGEERPVGHHPGDRTANLGVAQLGLRTQVLALGGGELALRALKSCLPADLLHGFQMLLGNLVGGLRLNQRSLGGIQIAAWNRPLGEELCPAVDDALGQVQVGARLGQVKFRLCRVFGNRRPVAISYVPWAAV